MLKHIQALREVRDRLDLLYLVNELSLDGYGVELGVANGHYSNTILKTTKLKLFSVDRWSDRGHNDKQHQIATDKLKTYGDRSTIIRKTFHEAVTQFQDLSFDFIYIDGYAHTGQDNGETLTDWWPKLKTGGIFSGHDYNNRWPKTIAVVDAFFKSKGLRLHSTNSQNEFQSWFTVK